MREAGIPFGSYLLLKRLARGGMAEVFLARQRGPEGFERRVALKRILPHLVDTSDFVRMFLDEARLAARLTHPNIVHIYEFGQVEEHYFIAMEFVDGVHAGALIDRGSYERMPAALVARIGADACAGLNYAHNIEDHDGRPLHLVHRDVSPPNLMLSHDGVIKLVDFGIAKAVSSVEKTRPGIVKGKFAYMSPEQTMGRKLDHRSDVFSLGLILWELLAGRVAVERTDPVAAMTAIRDGKLPSIRDVRPELPPKLGTVLNAALCVDPGDRLTAAELGNELESFIKSSPELGTPMQLSQWIRQRFRRPDPKPAGPPATLSEGDMKMAPGHGPPPPAPPPGRDSGARAPERAAQRGAAERSGYPMPRLDSQADRPTQAMSPAPITDENTTIDSSAAYLGQDDEGPTEIAPHEPDAALAETVIVPPKPAPAPPKPTTAKGPIPIPHPRRPAPAGPPPSTSGAARPVAIPHPRRPAPASRPPPLGAAASGRSPSLPASQARRPAPASRPPPMQNARYAQHYMPNMYPAQHGVDDANRRLWMAAIAAFVLAALVALALLLDGDAPAPGDRDDAGTPAAEAPRGGAAE